MVATVLGGVKGALAALGGCAALDPACAPCSPQLSMAPTCCGTLDQSRFRPCPVTIT